MAITDAPRVLANADARRMVAGWLTSTTHNDSDSLGTARPWTMAALSRAAGAGAAVDETVGAA
jgi:hypothetical protein